MMGLHELEGTMLVLPKYGCAFDSPLCARMPEEGVRSGLCRCFRPSHQPERAAQCRIRLAMFNSARVAPSSNSAGCCAADHSRSEGGLAACTAAPTQADPSHLPIGTVPQSPRYA